MGIVLQIGLTTIVIAGLIYLLYWSSRSFFGMFRGGHSCQGAGDSGCSGCDHLTAETKNSEDSMVDVHKG